MPHVELSLSEPIVPNPRPEPGAWSAIQHWTAAVAEADEPCLVVEGDGTIVALSRAGGRLLSIDPAGAVLPNLFDDVLPLVDFTAASAPLAEADLALIPPLLAISSGRLARGLLRLKVNDATACTLDVIATPLRDNGSVVGSLSFLCEV